MNFVNALSENIYKTLVNLTKVNLLNKLKEKGMKKILYGFLVLVVLCFVALYILLFTSIGNSIVANIAQNKIRQSGLDVNITRFVLRFSDLNLQADLANLANLNVQGKLNPFKLAFDLDYSIVLNKDYAKARGFNLDKNFEFIGKVVGKSKDFNASGRGYLFGSDVKLDSRIYDYNPLLLKLDAKAIKVEELLNIFSLPQYAKARLDILADIKAQNLKPDGNAIIKLNTDTINYAQIKKDFGVDLPKNSNPNAELLATIKGDKIYMVAKILNDYLALQSQKALYDLARKSLNTDFKLEIPHLAKLESLTKTKLTGSLNVDGNLSLLNNNLSGFNADVLGLGGKLNAEFKNNKFNVLAKEVPLEKLLALLGYGSLMNGKLNANLQSVGLDFKNFVADAKIFNAKINPDTIKKLTGLEFPNASLSLDAKANAKNAKIDYEGILLSDLLNIKKLKGFYNLNNSELKLDADAFIDDLSVFNTLAKQKLQGNMVLNSKAHLLGSEIQNLDLNANLANGTINAKSNGKSLDLDIVKLDLEKLLLIAAQPNYANGIINAKAHFDNIDLSKLNGSIKLQADGVLNSTTLSKILEKNFPKNTNYALKTQVDIKNSLAAFEGSLNSSLANLSHFKGNFDLNKMLLNSDYILNVSDFSKLGFLLERKLSGSADFNGKIAFDKNLEALILSENLFGGKLNANLKNNIINANLQAVSLPTLAQSFDLIDIYEGKANLSANYNLLSQRGKANLNMKDGKLKKNTLINAINLITAKDITNDVYHTTNADVNINKNLIDFNLNMQAQRSDIRIYSGTLNSQTGALNVPFEAKIDRADFKGVLSGTSANPKVKLDAQSVINTIQNITKGANTKEKAQKQLDKLFNKIF